ncbi:hypothetical protein CEP88_03865 [Roseobacter denitrificans]|nr:hypothetical protein CEP88_03865 [Roseobacter denitrificans]
MLMPKWWQLFVMVFFSLCSLLWVAPVILFFTHDIGLPSALALFAAVVGFQYIARAVVNWIEVTATRRRVSELMNENNDDDV